MGVSLDDEEKGILKYLGRKYEEEATIDDLTKYLSDLGYGRFSKREFIDKMDHLIDLGYVRSRTEGKGKDRQEIFYLSKLALGLWGGVAKKRNLQGRGPQHDISRLFRRMMGALFLAMGLGLFAYEGPRLTGAVIGTHIQGFLTGALFIFFGLALLFIKPKKSR